MSFAGLGGLHGMPELLETHTVDAPGVRLAYDVRGSLADVSADDPVLMLIGSPMDAAGFATLASHFPDRTVVTYDPRGTARSVRTDGARESTPEDHAGDLHRIIAALGAGPVDLFATSGGAVNALALVAKHPGDVRTLVAHEPPTAEVLPDGDRVLAACQDMYDTYQRSGRGPAMAKFMQVAMLSGPLPDDYAERPVPDPAAFGLPADDDGSRDDPLLGQNMRTCSQYRHDYAALAAAPTRIVVAAGEESRDQLPGRGAAGVAERLGLELTVFPSHHGGFLGPESGWPGKPEEFAAALRQALAG
jgi:pimeloyl-ACP methyl ester carboxylesterase